MEIALTYFEALIAFGVWFNVCLQFYDIVWCRLHDCKRKTP